MWFLVCHEGRWWHSIPCGKTDFNPYLRCFVSSPSSPCLSSFLDLQGSYSAYLRCFLSMLNTPNWSSQLLKQKNCLSNVTVEKVWLAQIWIRYKCDWCHLWDSKSAVVTISAGLCGSVGVSLHGLFVWHCNCLSWWLQSTSSNNNHKSQLEERYNQKRLHGD